VQLIWPCELVLYPDTAKRHPSIFYPLRRITQT
jgi:hypothetical protein